MLRRIRQRLSSRTTRWSAAIVLLVGLLFGALGWAGFGAVVASSNTLDFCISCHEMQAFVYEEYRQTKHFQNHAGVRTTCADCHVPKAFWPKMWRKAEATYNELPKHLLGTIDTAEKFEARRPALAEKVWAEMKANDSRECRACHSHEAMELASQKPRARSQHLDALNTGETCIDCHKGVAHALPAEATPSETADDEQDFSL